MGSLTCIHHCFQFLGRHYWHRINNSFIILQKSQKKSLFMIPLEIWRPPTFMGLLYWLGCFSRSTHKTDPFFRSYFICGGEQTHSMQFKTSSFQAPHLHLEPCLFQLKAYFVSRKFPNLTNTLKLGGKDAICHIFE